MIGKHVARLVDATRRLAGVGAMLGGWLLAGCGSEPSSTSSSVVEAPALRQGERAFQVRGVVRDLPLEGTGILVRHEEIPGYMPKMTMELTVSDTNELVGLSVGDEIEFRLVARADDHFIDGIRRTGTRVEVEAMSSASVAANGDIDPEPEDDPELKVGEPVPDVGMRLETGEEVRLSRWRGHAVAMTFFFTRCPLPDFCPRMNRNFQEARDLLAGNAGGPTNWVFLSLSFDADFDQPAVLRTHAGQYRGTNASGWWFGALGASGLAAVKPAFDLMISRDGGSFSHNLRTVVIDPRGHVFRQFDGNRWTPEELAAAIAAASRHSPEAPAAGR